MRKGEKHFWNCHEIVGHFSKSFPFKKFYVFLCRYFFIFIIIWWIGGFNFHGHFCVRSVRSVCFVCVWLLALFRRYLRFSFISLLGNLSPPDIFKLHEKKEKGEPQLKVSKCVCAVIGQIILSFSTVRSTYKRLITNDPEFFFDCRDWTRSTV